jgi:hypothetical protein
LGFCGTNQLSDLLAPINFGKQITGAETERGGDVIQLYQEFSVLASGFS